MARVGVAIIDGHMGISVRVWFTNHKGSIFRFLRLKLKHIFELVRKQFLFSLCCRFCWDKSIVFYFLDEGVVYKMNRNTCQLVPHKFH